MSPDDQWVKWIAFAAAITQTVAAIVQLSLGAAGSVSRRSVSSGVTFGLVAIVFEVFGRAAPRRSRRVAARE